MNLTQKKLAEKCAKLPTGILIEMWDKLGDPHLSHADVAEIRHAIMNEFERRDVAAFNAWMEAPPSEMDHPRNFFN